MAWLTAQHQVGMPLEPVSRRFAPEMFAAGGAKTIHNDAEAAQREGLAGPIAVGPQIAALIFRMMGQAFGKGWIEGGKISISFRRPTASDAFATAKGVITEIAREGEMVRIACDVWVETEDGKKTIQGTASGLVPAVAQLAPSGPDDGHGS